MGMKKKLNKELKSMLYAMLTLRIYFEIVNMEMCL